VVSDYKFVEQEDHEQGFAAIFDSDIAPLLQELEEKRIKAVRKSQIWVALIMTVFRRPRFSGLNQDRSVAWYLPNSLWRRRRADRLF
jgi:hypothetical protein